MQLSSKHIDLMKHCIGLHRRKPYRRHGKLFYKPYRNYFDCGRHDDPDWSELADCDLAVDFNGQGWYKLTGAGFSALSRIIGSIFITPSRAKRHWPIKENFLSSTLSA